VVLLGLCVCVCVCVAVVGFVVYLCFLVLLCIFFLFGNSLRLSAGSSRAGSTPPSFPHLSTQLNVGSWFGSPSAKQPVV
jgi:hypothetical protein